MIDLPHSWRSTSTTAELEQWLDENPDAPDYDDVLDEIRAREDGR